MNRALPFFKIDSAGNDFVLLEGQPRADASELVRSLCRAHTGIGADGVVFVWPQEENFMTQVEQKWSWEYLNSDGGRASMCGNAARGLGVWFARKFPKERNFNWKAETGQILAHVSPEGLSEVSWDLQPQLQPVPAEVQNLIPGVQTAWVQAGVPHIVLIQAAEWPAERRAALAPKLRSHAALGYGGANVTFVSLENSDTVSFERGVEGETLACGSGAVAAFLALKGRQREFKFPGGTLGVREANGRVWLSGPAKISFEGTFYYGP